MSHRRDSTSHGNTTQRGENDVPVPEASELALLWLHPAPTHALTGFVKPPVLLGRGGDCAARLDGVQISRHHAELFLDGKVWQLRDLGSTNGVFVNGIRVATSPLSIGDIVRLGEWIGLVVYGRPRSRDAEPDFRYEHGIAQGRVLRPVVELALRGACTDLPIVIQGETGTGKELFARAIHTRSARPGPLLAVNCAALPESLAEAELFGYRKGAFTGADRNHMGHFRAAHQGTLFLDEVTDLPLTLQAKLLRAIENQEVIPVGESNPVKVDVRVVAAAQVPLRTKVSEQRFRADLAARLDGVTVTLPPLRERVEEIPRLFDWFVRKHSGGQRQEFEPRLIETLCLYAWPANVRELELLARRLVGLYGDNKALTCSHLPEHMLIEGQGTDGTDRESQATKDASDFSSLLTALRRYAGNIARAASSAGISRRRAYRLLHEHPEVDIEALREVAGRANRNASADEDGKA